MLGPSTRQPQFLYSLRRLFQRSCLERTFALPKITIPYLALVRATFSLLGSLRKPMPEASLLLTQDKRMKSFSLPQKLSTEATSISLQSAGSSDPCLCIQFMMKTFWPSQGVMIPIWSGLKPALKNAVTTYSTLAASILFRKDVPEEEISSLLIEW